MGDRLDSHSLPVVHPDNLTDTTDCPDRSVLGVVLSGGTSTRYGGRNKLLEIVDGWPLVRHSVATLTAANVTAVSVVVGYQSKQVTAAVWDLDVAVIENDQFTDGQSMSLQVGVTWAQKRDADALVVALGDMPSVSTESVDQLVTAYRQGAGDALAAACNGVRGNPVLFDAAYFDKLLSIDGDTGGQAVLFNAEQPALVETGDLGVLFDVDQPADLEK